MYVNGTASFSDTYERELGKDRSDYLNPFLVLGETSVDCIIWQKHFLKKKSCSSDYDTYMYV